MTVGDGPDIRVSWIVVSHQSARDLEVLLPSLVPALERLAAAGADPELIVVDNASTDGSADVVRRLVPGATVLSAPDNLGYGQAIDLAATHARGDWLAVGNADLLVPEGGLDELAATLARQAPDVALVGPSILDTKRRKSPSVGSFPTLFSLLTGLARSCERRKYVALDRHRAGDVDWVTGACFFLRARALAAVGGFDQAFFLYYEDVDLARRLHDQGLRRVYAPELEVLHLRPHHHRPPQDRIESYVRASRRAYFARHRPAWERWLLGLLGRLEPVLRRSRQEPAGPTPDAARVPTAVRSVPLEAATPPVAPSSRAVGPPASPARPVPHEAPARPAPVAGSDGLAARPAPAAGADEPARPAALGPAAAPAASRRPAADPRGANGHGRPASRIHGVGSTAVAREGDP